MRTDDGQGFRVRQFGGRSPPDWRRGGPLAKGKSSSAKPAAAAARAIVVGSRILYVGLVVFSPHGQQDLILPFFFPRFSRARGLIIQLL